MQADRIRTGVQLFAGAAIPLFLLLGCGGGGDGGTPPVAPRLTKTCADLQGAFVEASAIGLPTRGASVTSAVVVAGGGAGAAAYDTHCLVSGEIRPVDTSAPDIRFQLALPNDWNGKALMLGGAGFNGSIPSVSTPDALWGASKARLPLGRGYAVYASDSGHQSAADVPPGAFASNEESLRNYAGDALKKTRDVAAVLIRSRYGRAASRSYFLGYSKGGGEALAVAQRWPADWDGVIAGAPGWNVTAVSLQMLSASQAVAAPGAWLNEAKRGLLYRAALGACDALDGVADGVISHVRACALQFDPRTAVHEGVPLRCPGGLDTGDTCLSDAQLTALQQVNEPTRLSYTLGSGETSLPGFPVYIADNGGGAGTPVQVATMTALGVFGAVAPAFVPTAAMSSAWQQADGFLRYVVLGDEGFNPLTLDIGSGDGVASRIGAVSALDANISDLSPFKNRGGKLILWTGTADMLISPRATEFFYARLQSTMGADKVDAFVRFYQVPGAQHGPSSVFQPEWDPLTAVEAWVERGVDPGNQLVVSDDAGVPGRTRPLCGYPAWPRYTGSGDVNSVASYVCASS